MKKTQRIQCGSNPGPLDYESNTLPLSHVGPGFHQKRFLWWGSMFSWLITFIGSQILRNSLVTHYFVNYFNFLFIQGQTCLLVIYLLLAQNLPPADLLLVTGKENPQASLHPHLSWRSQNYLPKVRLLHPLDALQRGNKTERVLHSLLRVISLKNLLLKVRMLEIEKKNYV